MDRFLNYLRRIHLIIKIGIALVTLWGQINTVVSIPTYKMSVQTYPEPILIHIRSSDHKRSYNDLKLIEFYLRKPMHFCVDIMPVSKIKIETVSRLQEDTLQ